MLDQGSPKKYWEFSIRRSNLRLRLRTLWKLSMKHRWDIATKWTKIFWRQPTIMIKCWATWNHCSSRLWFPWIKTSVLSWNSIKSQQKMPYSDPQQNSFASWIKVCALMSTKRIPETLSNNWFPSLHATTKLCSRESSKNMRPIQLIYLLPYMWQHIMKRIYQERTSNPKIVEMRIS